MTDELTRERDQSELDDDALEAIGEMFSTPPPPALRARVLDAVRREAEIRRSVVRLRRWRVATIASAAGLAAALALAIASGFEALRLQEDADVLRALELDRLELQARIEEQNEEHAVLAEALAVQSEVVRILSSPRLVTATLRASPGQENVGGARVLLDPVTGAVAVVGRGLAPPQAGRVYEVWAMRDDGPPEPAGLLKRTADPGGSADRSFAARLPHVREPREVTRFAISVEPEGGRAHPSGTIVLEGSIV